ncbi:MAG: hypothetical protein MJ133_01215 [Lachnospiraceae bacterium]|nr:hypothetical protein [Lachnospiraceae bacterium]
MKFGLSKKELIIRVIFFIVVAIIFGVFVRRLFLGMDVGDEVFNICNSFRVLHGNRLLVDVWDFYQFGDCFLAPFVWIYVKIVGSTDGIVLACRLFYLFINVCVGVFAYWALNDYFKSFYARISVSLAIIFYAPFSMYYLWYDTAGQLFFLIGVLLLLKDMKSPKIRWKILAGLFHCFMVIAYPSAIVVGLVELIIFFILNKKRKEKLGTFWYLMGWVIPVFLLLIYGIIQKFDFYLFDNPISNVNQTSETAVVHFNLIDINLGELFSREATGIVGKIWNSITSLISIGSVKNLLLLVIFLILFVIVIKFSWKRNIIWIRKVVYMIAGLAMFALALFFSEEDNRAVIFAYFFLAILLVAGLVADKDAIKNNKHIIVIAIIPSIVFFPIISMTATHGGSKAFMGLWVLSLMGLGIYVESGKFILEKIKNYYSPIHLLCVLGLIVFLFNNQFFEYEGTAQNMNYYVDHGVYKGLTIPNEYAVFIDFEDEIKSIMSDDVESIALFDEWPAAKYLAINGKKIQMPESGRPYKYVEGMDYANFMTYWERFGFPDAIIIKNDPEWYDIQQIDKTPGCDYRQVKQSEKYIVFENKDVK